MDDKQAYFTLVLKATEPNAAAAIVSHVQGKLQESGLVVQTLRTGEETLLLVYAPTLVLVSEAEANGLLKVDVNGRMLPFKASAIASFKMCEDKQLFNPSEKYELTRSVLYHVPPTPPLYELLQTKKHQSTILTVTSMCRALEIASVLEVQELHSQHAKRIWKRNTWALLAPVDELYAYFGSEVAFYFAWMNFYTVWLLFPGALGLLLWVHKMFFHLSVDENPYIPFFSLCVVLWAVAFQRFWRRTSQEWACKWGTIEDTENEHVRPEFHGDESINQINGLPTKVYPYWKRVRQYFVSALVTISMLSVAFLVMVCSLNLQGYIKDKNWEERIFYIPALAQYSETGSIFDPLGWFSLIPVGLHVIVILQLNKLYSYVANQLTEWENHRTHQQFENALVIKRFFFEAFDCYIALLYLAFFQFDVERLKMELVSLYTTDSLRRVAIETGLPAVLQLVRNLWNKARERKEVGARKKNDSRKKKNKQPEFDDKLLQEVQFELLKEEYEQFDDYLEMVIEFGYVTLFASAFPLASFLSLFCHVVEVKSDMFKLLCLLKRPPTERASNIGIWESIVQGLSFLCILTNCLIFSFTSEQMMQWFPSLFVMRDGDQDFVTGEGQYVVAICFAIEHIILLVAILITTFVPETPENVAMEVQRRRIDSQKLERELRQSPKDVQASPDLIQVKSSSRRALA